MAVLDPILWLIAMKYSCFELDTPSGESVTRIGDAYVDNTFLMIIFSAPATNHPDPPAQLTRKMEEISQNFERKIFSTGGEPQSVQMLLVFNFLEM